MATITIRNLDEKVKRKLRVRAALNGRSMEAEAREALTAALSNARVSPNAGEVGLGDAIHKRFGALGGVNLKIPPRKFSTRPLPRFDE